MEEETSGEWYGKIRDVKIDFGSSGTKQIIITSELLNKEDFGKLLLDVMNRVKAPDSVED